MIVRGALAVALVALTALVPAAHAAGPTITYTVTAGTAGENGWWLTDLTVQLHISGATNSTCPSFHTFTTNGQSLDCTATDGMSTVAFHLSPRIDEDTPVVTGASASRGPNGAGWYTAGFGVQFSGSDGTSGIASCAAVSYGGPDTAQGSLSGTCRDVAGRVSAAGSFAFRYDATAPELSISPERGPDANGWYNRPVGLTVSANGGASGLAGCATTPYSGPDSATATLSASCTDGAGNTASRSVAVKYDASPPKLTGLAAVAGSRTVTLRWRPSDDTAAVTVARRRGTRAPVTVYRGTGSSFVDRNLVNGVGYRYTITGVDAAANAASMSVTAVPRATAAPAEGARVSAPPLLSWHPVKADYYNVQLFCGRTKVLSAWPKQPRLKLQRAWRFEGRGYRLVPCRYRWYVWPGHGDRKAARYGKLLGSSWFLYVRR